MRITYLPCTVLGLLCTFGAQAQNAPGQGGSVPLYRVTVIERTVKAVNYQYRSDPTEIDFRGTVLLPEAKGRALVESKAGRTEIEARFEHLRPPTRYGREYLTYVIWAVTPQGHAKNLGELVAGPSDKVNLHITTDLQAFGLIVTAEPYAAVRQPSDVVIMENEIRPDTIGQFEPVVAKYELLARGSYTYNVPVDLVAAEGNGPKLPMDQYESLLQIYQAQNALQIARAMGADRYAADTFHKAETELARAQQLQASKAGRSSIVMAAREAAETAEDARTIVLKRQHDEEVTQARTQASEEQQRRIAAEAAARNAEAQSSADRMQLDQERVARQQAEAQAQAATARMEAQQAAPPPAPPPIVVVMPRANEDGRQQKKALRTALYQSLNTTGLTALDSPRGLVVMMPSLSAGAGGVERVAAIVAVHPGLMIEVSGNTDVDSLDAERLWRQRMDDVRGALIRGGVSPVRITTRYYGATRPVASDTTAAGREQNRRIEITITGDPIGNQPYWDKSYTLSPKP